MIGNRYSQHSFAQVPDVHVSRSMFDRSHTIKDTIQFDYLTPVYVDEVIPGDTINLNVNSFGRLATQKVPILDNLYLDYFFFFVPSRLVWTNWERFNGAQDDPGDSTDFLVPQIASRAVTGEVVGSIWDKFGLPTGIPGLSVNALPFRAYRLIWNEWFRDQNLQDSEVVDKDDGPDDITVQGLLVRNKRHDYFTSCLPWPQKGPDVLIPVGDIVRVDSAPNYWAAYKVGGNTPAVNGTPTLTGGTGNWTDPAGTLGISFDPRGGLEVDQTDVATINTLREAFQVQSLLELDARGGSRYVEILRAHFNVVSPDFRLQRPEYLGGGSARINIHPVTQNSKTDGTNVLGTLGAIGTVSTQGSRIGFTKSFVEHGYVIGMVCPRADVTYQQGINRMWCRETRYEFFWPKLQELGEQAVLMKELIALGTANDDLVFGYQERYAEYRYKPSEIRGAFRSTYATSLDMWHMAQEFSTVSPPTLNTDFIQQATPIDRSIAVTNEPHVLLDVFFEQKHARPMLTYSTPVSLGRF